VLLLADNKTCADGNAPRLISYYFMTRLKARFFKKAHHDRYHRHHHHHDIYRGAYRSVSTWMGDRR